MPHQPNPPRRFMDELWKKLTLGAIVGAVALEVATKTISPIAYDMYAQTHDALFCQGREAEAEGDRLSDQAERELEAKEVANAQALFQRAITAYEKAYKCGFPDSGIRLAVAHCMGFGTPKNELKARQYVLEIEAKHPSRAGRAGDVRKLCGM